MDEYNGYKGSVNVFMEIFDLDLIISNVHFTTKTL